MILVKHVEFLEVDENPVKIMHETSAYDHVEARSDKGRKVCQVTELLELVQGRRFRRPGDGQEVVIGMSKQAEEVLGLQYDAWRNLLQESTKNWDSYIAARNELSEIKRAGFFKRLSWLFEGYRR